jgi:hypothetical protein
MGPEEYAEWKAFGHLEPLGADRDDYRFAVLCAVVLNLWPSGGDPITHADLLRAYFDFWGDRRAARDAPTEEEERLALAAWGVGAAIPG